MPPDKRTMEVIAAFKRYLKSDDRTDVDSISLEELRRADQQLGWRDKDADFRLALQTRIKELEGDRARAKKSHARALNWVITLCIGIIVGLVLYYLTKSSN